jgi:uncharacterized membrane protein YdbT with pleckstrin-like domain
MKTRYPSAVDTWIAILLIGTPVLVVAFGISIVVESAPAGFIVIGVGIFIGGLIASLAIPCHYTIDDQCLKIKCGILGEDIALEKIVSIEKSGSLLSAPALSTKRVKIVLVDGFRLISPKDREGFIEVLQQKIKSH